MASINAKLVAEEVLDNISKGKKISKRKILLKHGYSETTATVPSLVTNTKSYKETTQPYIERLKKYREKLMSALETKDLPKERFKDLADSLSRATHDLQVLTGGTTEIIEITGINYIVPQEPKK